ncbi:4-oxalocrotonate tautomerase [Pediococcus inopinatus]|uniref:4-oxalocrotonate tautomerase n=2 Tax=Pediococcus inopinatus TaxID=114090 RepID=A0ABZ0Q6H2_9LACO|nr:2-hydroxymuconate tautomerase [Pediococcus inopinatus]WPC17590.1 4-oxalocrotonate tautomerase [Pediococcus inopinatus]WPC22580.1 4-oxalocrotonate tautomerase [Pediococcus inopinatus]
MRRKINMPLVHIDLIEGRSTDQLRNLVKEVTAAVSKNTGAPAEHIHIVLNEMRPDRYSDGGVLRSDEK